MNARNAPKDPAQSPPARKSPVPSPETEALRAVRKLRELKAKADAALKTYQKTRDECLEMSLSLERDLSPAAKELVDILRAKEEPEMKGGGL